MFEKLNIFFSFKEVQIWRTNYSHCVRSVHIQENVDQNNSEFFVCYRGYICFVNNRLQLFIYFVIF